MKNLIAFTLFFVLAGCLSTEEEDSPKKIYVVCSKEDHQKGKCSRFMDRKIYLSFSTGSDPAKNNAFQKAEIMDALNDIAQMTNLGAGYFAFEEIDPVLIEPLVEQTASQDGFRSFIQVWPDLEFNDFANKFGFIPDQNAITVINSANKRQFYMILRASCFTPNNVSCTNDAAAIMGTNGIRALMARQLSSLVGIPLDCSLGTDKTMCPDFPNDNQWTLNERQYWSANFNNALETISQNPNFYEEFFLE